MDSEVVTLLIFLLTIIGVLICINFNPKINFTSINKSITITYIWPPVIGCLLLLLTFQMSPRQMWLEGVVGDDHIQPYTIVLLVVSIAVVCISLDHTGALSYLAFKVVTAFATTKLRLFILIYVLSCLLSTLTSTHVVVLTMTNIVIYSCQFVSLDPTPYLYASFQAANLGALLFVVSNPTNVVIGQSMGIDFLEFTKYMAFPALVCFLTGLITMIIYYHDELGLTLMEAMCCCCPGGKKNKNNKNKNNKPHRSSQSSSNNNNNDMTYDGDNDSAYTIDDIPSNTPKNKNNNNNQQQEQYQHQEEEEEQDNTAIYLPPINISDELKDGFGAVYHTVLLLGCLVFMGVASFFFPKIHIYMVSCVAGALSLLYDLLRYPMCPRKEVGSGEDGEEEDVLGANTLHGDNRGGDVDELDGLASDRRDVEMQQMALRNNNNNTTRITPRGNNIATQPAQIESATTDGEQGDAAILFLEKTSTGTTTMNNDTNTICNTTDNNNTSNAQASPEQGNNISNDNNNTNNTNNNNSTTTTTRSNPNNSTSQDFITIPPDQQHPSEPDHPDHHHHHHSFHHNIATLQQAIPRLSFHIQRQQEHFHLALKALRQRLNAINGHKELCTWNILKALPWDAPLFVCCMFILIQSMQYWIEKFTITLFNICGGYERYAKESIRLFFHPNDITRDWTSFSNVLILIIAFAFAELILCQFLSNQPATIFLAKVLLHTTVLFQQYQAQHPELFPQDVTIYDFAKNVAENTLPGLAGGLRNGVMYSIVAASNYAALLTLVAALGGILFASLTNRKLKALVETRQQLELQELQLQQLQQQHQQPQQQQQHHNTGETSEQIIEEEGNNHNNNQQQHTMQQQHKQQQFVSYISFARVGFCTTWGVMAAVSLSILLIVCVV